MSTLPPGTAGADFDQLVSRLTDLLGSDAVITDESALREYRDPYSYREASDFDAAAVLAPTTTEQVQGIVQLANEYKVPLWTIGQGRNNTYGGPAPRVKGSLILSLRNMNKVLEIDEELAYAVVEPGVRWFDLYDALQAQGGNLWSSIPDLGWGSVLGNSLDYGIGYSPNGDHASNLCGMEIVLANGEVLRTGLGGVPGNNTWHTYPHAYGPAVEGLFKQSNYGIVTKVGVWLMPRPERYTAGWVRFEGFEPLGPVVDTLRGLMLEGIITNLPMFSRGLDFDEHGAGQLSPGGQGWSARFALYGRPALVEAAWDVVEEAFSRVPDVSLARRDFDGADSNGPSNHDERVQRGIPDMDLLNPDLLPFGADTAHLDLSPLGTAKGEDAVRLEKLMADLDQKHGRFSVGGILLNTRYALHITTTFYDPRDQQQTDRVFESYADMVTDLAEHGYVPYRTNLQNMDHVAEKFSFGNHAQRRFAETLKDALDPNGILAPGKSGIWPKHLRPAR